MHLIAVTYLLNLIEAQSLGALEKKLATVHSRMSIYEQIREKVTILKQKAIGGVIKIEKCYVSTFNNQIYLNIGRYSRWKTTQEDIKIKEVAESNEVKKKSLNIIKICNVRNIKKGINLEKVKVLEKSNIRAVNLRKDGSTHEVTDILLGDETGIVKCSIWDEDVKNLEEEMVLKIYNAYTSTFKGEIQLNLSRFSKYEILPPEKIDINIENNVSLTEAA